MNTEERLENAIKNRPDTYSTVRDNKGNLLEVQDHDSGRFYTKVVSTGAWIWID